MADLQTRRLGDVAFTCPANWLVEPLPGLDGLIVVDPQGDNAFRSNVLLEWVDPVGADSAAVALERLCEVLTASRPGLHVRRREVVPHALGGELGVVEYDSLQDGLGLTQLDALWQWAPGRRLMVTAASTVAEWPRCESVFSSLLASLCALGAAA